ncbi:hypothetical protein PENFLA_c012G05447 [Penicillium flavigenum]|uniref:Uncharacterized protein n=1 Tax=Penicillium flavigenum TaxID=254877 RepID=A0A1V6T9N5_9EURO|nr:hypothetical protein PENFLA_c012G05447 [Penicillium flavigenum]
MAKQQDSYDLDLDRKFLKDLPPSIKRYTYHGEEQFFDIFQTEFTHFEASTEASECLLFHASKEAIETIFNPENIENEDTPISRLCSSYDLSEQLFLVTMPSGPHGAAGDLINTVIREVLTPMNLSTSLQGYVGTITRGHSRGKIPDYGWRPRRPGQPSTPSVTLEVALSESDSKLNSDVRFWLNPDDSDTNICLTLRINRSRPEIRIEKWERQNDKPHRSQVIWISRKKNQTHVSDHPLVIPFESLFRRNPTGPAERDLAISQQQLVFVAEALWEEQKL